MLLALFFSLTVTQLNFEPYAETAADREALKILQALFALTETGHPAEPAAIEQLNKLGGRKTLEHLLKAPEPLKRAYAVYGLRLVKARGVNMQFLRLDPQAMVRRQVLLYLAQDASVSIDAVKGSLADPSPEVRMAAVTAVVRLARAPAQAVKLLRGRLAVEKDANVIKLLQRGLAAFGEPSN